MVSGERPVTGPYVVGTVRGWELMAKEGSSTHPPNSLSSAPLCPELGPGPRALLAVVSMAQPTPLPLPRRSLTVEAASACSLLPGP